MNRKVLPFILAAVMAWGGVPAPALAEWNAQLDPAYVAQNTNQLKALRDALAKAQVQQTQAKSEFDAAQEAYNEAKAAYDGMSEAFEAAQAKVDRAKAAWDEAVAATAAAQNEVDAAQDELNQNAASIAAAQAEVGQAQAAADGSAVLFAQQRVDDAQAAAQQAQQRVNDAQDAIDAEVSDPGTNQNHKEWTAYGLFQSIRNSAAPGSAEYWDAQCAMDILDGGVNTTGHTYAKNQGPQPDGPHASSWANIASNIAWSQRGDAVSLGNLLTSLELLSEFNSIRAEENLAEGTALRTDIGTNCRQMAISIVQCDASKEYSVSHTQAYEGLENLSWSSRKAVSFSRSKYTDPYVDWYDEEKVNYQTNNGGVTGHYKTIVDLNSSYYCEIAGFAVCNYNASYGECRELSTFGDFFNYNTNPTPEVQYSVDTFLSLANAYYDEQVSAGMLGTTDEVKAQHRAELNDATAALQSAQNEVSAAQAALAQAQEAQRNAEAALAQAQSELAQLQSQMSGLQTKLQGAQQALNAKQQEEDAAQQAYEDADAELQAIDANGSYTQAKAALDDAQTTLAQKTSAYANAQAAVSQCADALDDFTNLATSDAILVEYVANQVYSGSAHQPKPRVTARLSSSDYVTLVEGTDFRYEYQNNEQAGTATVRIVGLGAKGSGSWWGAREVSFQIDRQNLTSAELASTTCTYDGKDHKPTLRSVASGILPVPAGGYALTYARNGKATTDFTSAGTIDVTVSGKGNYAGTLSLSFTIAPKAVTPKVSLSASSFVYTGKAQKPSVTVKVGSTKLTTSQYSLTWSKDVKSVGAHSVKVTLKGNYQGSKSASYKIVPKGTAITKLTPSSKAISVSWTKQATQTTGYEVQYATAKTFKGAKTVTVANAKTTSKKILKLTAQKTYYVRVRTYKVVWSTTYYSAWSAAESAKTK